jgi:hypothetical protein
LAGYTPEEDYVSVGSTVGFALGDMNRLAGTPWTGGGGSGSGAEYLIVELLDAEY